MSVSTDLSELEEGIYRSTFDDGIADLLFGSVVLAWGVGLNISFEVLGAIAAAVAMGLWPLLRQRFSRPRVGYVKLSAPRRQRERQKLWMLLVVGVGGLALASLLVYGRPDGSWAEVLGPGVGGFLLALPALLTALVTGVVWFGVYALLLAVAGVTGILGWLTPDVYAMVAGVAILGLGVARLVRFLRAHPIREGA